LYSLHVIQALSEEVRTLHAALKTKQNEVSTIRAGTVVQGEIEVELQSTREQKHFLEKEVNRLQLALESAENSDSRIAVLKRQVEEAEKGRTQFEKTMISNYERKLSLMKMNKDVTIDGLRKELSQHKERQRETEADLLNKIRSLEKEKIEVEGELKAKMDHKNAMIEHLEQTLSAHEQVSSHMQDDLNHLQSGYETVSVTRRAEIEELQEELVDVQTKATKYEREITSLKMKLEEQKLQHRNEVSRLESAIDSLETDTESPMMRDVAMQRQRHMEHEYRQQVEGLRSKINSLQEENVNIKHEMEKNGKQRSSNNDKYRNSQLHEQVVKLQQRLREYEGDNDSIRSSRSLRIPRSPMGAHRRDSFNRNSGRDDISTRTDVTF